MIKNFTFDEAQKLGNSDWRVPTADELDTLINFQPANLAGMYETPHVNNIVGAGSIFPDMDSGNLDYWTSSLGDLSIFGKVTSFEGHTIVGYDMRTSGYYAKYEPEFHAIALRTKKYPVRLVGTKTTWVRPPVAKVGYHTLADDEARDEKRDLVWKRCSVGQQWDGKSKCVGEIKKVNFEDAQKLATNGWRLPSKEELLTLIDLNRYGRKYLPVIDVVAFPNIGDDLIIDSSITADGGEYVYLIYWTNEKDVNGGYAVNFGRTYGDPEAEQYSNGERGAVRLVKNGNGQ